MTDNPSKSETKQTSVFEYITGLMIFLNKHPECIHIGLDDALEIMEKDTKAISIDFPQWSSSDQLIDEKKAAKEKWMLLVDQFNDQLEEIYEKDSKAGLDTLKSIREAMIEFAKENKIYQKKFSHFQEQFNKAKITIAKRHKI